MIKFIFFIFISVFAIQSYGSCRAIVKDIDLEELQNSSINSYADGKVRINTHEHEGYVADIFDNRGMPYSGVTIKTRVFRETDNRFFVLKWFSKKELKVENYIEIDLSDEAIKEDIIIGKRNQILNFVLKINNISYKFETVFSTDLSPGCNI